MKLVLFERSGRKRAKTDEAAERPPRVSEEEVRRFHRPRVLKLFAYGNLAVALFYSALGTVGIISIMFFDGAIGQRVAFSDMIELLQRSLLHSAAAGAALIVDHVMAQLTAIVAIRQGAAPSEALSPPASGERRAERVAQSKPAPSPAPEPIETEPAGAEAETGAEAGADPAKPRSKDWFGFR